MQIPAISTSQSYSFNHSPNQSSLNSATEPSKLTGQKVNGADDSEPANNTQTKNSAQELTEDERRQIEQLIVIDREVRAHEAAHLAAAGGLARGGASFSYQAGPDGRVYAVGGEVSINTSAVDGNPQATIQKAQTIRAAALAPAQPSSADQAAAAAASQLEASARIELAVQRAEEQEGHSEDDSVKNTEVSMDVSKGSASILTKPDAEIDQYQNISESRTSSDLIGQLLNATV